MLRLADRHQTPQRLRQVVGETDIRRDIIATAVDDGVADKSFERVEVVFLVMRSGIREDEAS